MKFPLSWIKEYVNVDVKPEKLASELRFSGTNIDSFEKKDGDVIFDFEITPNRADCYSVVGIAREIAALNNTHLIMPPVFSKTQNSNPGKNVKLTVKEGELCPTYSLGVVDSIKVGSSPNWMVERLEKSGLRSINNIVDITNYVMLETGQPMHAFDLNKIKGDLTLRTSIEGEKLVTLDGVERLIPKGSIIIEDGEKIIDLAGLMGGASSQIGKKTDKIVLHVPIYDPLLIRKTSQSLGLRTEASGRFEKKLDPAAHRFAFERALELFRTLAGGSLASEIKSVAYPPKLKKIQVRTSLINRTLGIQLSASEMKEILEKLEFSVSADFDGKTTSFEVGVPSFRTDVSDPIDITEEISRIHGYNNFPKTLAEGSIALKPKSELDFEYRLKQLLSTIGLNETIGNPLTSYFFLENLGIDKKDCIRIVNRLVSDYEYLRPTLVVSLLESLKVNQEDEPEVSIFEIGRVFDKKSGSDGLPVQPKKLGILTTSGNLNSLKGYVNTLIKKLNITNTQYKKTTSRTFGGQSINVLADNSAIGVLGEITNRKLEALGISRPTYIAELDLTTLGKKVKPPTYKPLPKYPIVKENISVFVPQGLAFEVIATAIKQAAGENFYKLDVIEDTIIKKKRSILLDVRYFDKKKTLDKDDIAKIRDRVISALTKKGLEPRLD